MKNYIKKHKVTTHNEELTNPCDTCHVRTRGDTNIRNHMNYHANFRIESLHPGVNNSKLIPSHMVTMENTMVASNILGSVGKVTASEEDVSLGDHKSPMIN